MVVVVVVVEEEEEGEGRTIRDEQRDVLHLALGSVGTHLRVRVG